MGQDVVVTYRADVDDLTQKLKIVIDRMDKLEAESKQAAKGLDTTTKSADKLGNELADVGKNTNKATADVKGFAKSANSSLKETGSSIKSFGLGIAASIGAAFSIDAVVQFAKASINAFLEAGDNADKLRFSITQIGGESDEAFQRLIDQSAKLQKITIFSDDSIQQAQDALATFGLTSYQIEELLPKLADFASATKTDIVQAAQQVGAGLDGAGKQFHKLGIEVSASATEVENYKTMLEGMSNVVGAAESATKSLTGQLIQQENEVGELQESIGEKLAPAWVKVKKATLGATLAVIEYIKYGGDLLASILGSGVENLGNAYDEVSDKVKELTDANIELGQSQDDASQNAINSIRKEILARLDLAEAEKKSAEDGGSSDRVLRRAKLRVEAVLNEVKAINSVSDARKKQTENYSKYLTEEDLASLSIEELNKKLKENEKLFDIVSQSNVKNIKYEIEVRRDLLKLIEATKSEINKTKLSLIDPETYADAIERIEDFANINKKNVDDEINLSIEKLKSDKKYTITAKNLLEQLRTKRKQLIDEQEKSSVTVLDKATLEKNKALLAELDALNFEEALIIKTDEIEANNRKLTKSFEALEKAYNPEGGKKKIKISALPGLKEDAKEQITIVNESIKSEADLRIQAIEADKLRRLNDIKSLGIENNERKAIIQNAEVAIQRINSETTKKQQDNLDLLNKFERDHTATKLKLWLDRNKDIIDASIQLFNDLNSLYDEYARAQVDKINKNTEAELEALDLLATKNKENLDKKRISEREFANNQKRIEEEKIKVQAAADKKSRDIKRKAALLDKAAALFQIAISTAQNIASTKLIPLIVLYAAAGAAQAAIVAAQPIPYAKGTKSAKQGLARVGEQGEEIMYVPGGTKVLPNSKTVTYGSVLDKMFDGTFDKYYMKREIAPRMVAQRKAHEATKEKSFARNISESIVLNNSLDTNPIARQLGKGQRITNVDEIADAIARRTEISPYRR